MEDRWIDEGLRHPPPSNIQTIRVRLKPLTHSFCGWDAAPDLAQATWEWPEPWQPETTSVVVSCWKTTDSRDLWL